MILLWTFIPTFKSDFYKLVVPRIQAPLLPDYLKKNFLVGQALQLVKELPDLDTIWDRLKSSYGDVITLMSKKLGSIHQETPLFKVKGDAQVTKSLLKLKNCMTDLKSLATKHDLESHLFHTSNVYKIFCLLGRRRQTELTKLFVASGHSERDKWDEIITYLDNELKVTEQLLLLDKSDQKTEDSRNPKSSGSGSKPGSTFHASEPSVTTCHLCGKDGYCLTVKAKGKNVINYFSCLEFVNSDCKKRMQMLRKKRLCFQCLSPGVKAGHSGACFDKYRCPNASHKSYKRSFHVLICDEHKNDPENLKILEDYKTKCIFGSKSVDNFEEFSKNISLFHSQSEAFVADEKEPDFMRALYLTQTIKIGGRLFNLFYDNGCGDSCSKKKMADFLASLDKAKCFQLGPMIINGVFDLFAHMVGMRSGFRPGTGKKPLSVVCVSIKLHLSFPAYP